MGRDIFRTNPFRSAGSRGTRPGGDAGRSRRPCSRDRRCRRDPQANRQGTASLRREHRRARRNSQAMGASTSPASGAGARTPGSPRQESSPRRGDARSGAMTAERSPLFRTGSGDGGLRKIEGRAMGASSPEINFLARSRTKKPGPARTRPAFSARGQPSEARPPITKNQFLDLSTRAFSEIHGIMPRSFEPTSSIG